MANVLVLLSDLQTGRSSSTVEVRLLRFWEARNVRHGGELMTCYCLILRSEMAKQFQKSFRVVAYSGFKNPKWVGEQLFKHNGKVGAPELHVACIEALIERQAFHKRTSREEDDIDGRYQIS